jgi:hypothetical protein
MTTISTPTELITAVPFLLNAAPEECLVFIALSEGAVALAVQAELPHSPELNGAELYLAPLRESDIDQLLVLAYLPSDFAREQGDQIWEQLQRICEKIAPVKDFLIIHQGRWRSFLCKNQECCDPAGEPLPDIASSEFAAEHVFQGLVMPPLTPAPAEPTDLLTLLDRARTEFERCEPSNRSKRGVIALLRLISHFTIKRELENQNLVADALIAHGDENLELHRELWRALLDSAPVGYRGPTATLLALVRYEGGDIEGAKRALERALTDDPHYSLAHLLQKTFAAGWPPEAFTTMRHQLHPKLEAELLG